MMARNRNSTSSQPSSSASHELQTLVDDFRAAADRCLIWFVYNWEARTEELAKETEDLYAAARLLKELPVNTELLERTGAYDLMQGYCNNENPVVKQQAKKVIRQWGRLYLAKQMPGLDLPPSIAAVDAAPADLDGDVNKQVEENAMRLEDIARRLDDTVEHLQAKVERLERLASVSQCRQPDEVGSSKMSCTKCGAIVNMGAIFEHEC